MNDHLHNLPDPEEFWPDAEKMLDGHFKAKRRRRSAVLLSALLIVLSAVLYFTYDSETPVAAENSSSAPEQLSPSAPQTESSPAPQQVVEPSVASPSAPERSESTVNVQPAPSSSSETTVAVEKSVKPVVDPVAEVKVNKVKSNPALHQSVSVKSDLSSPVVQPIVSAPVKEVNNEVINTQPSETAAVEEIPVVVDPIRFLSLNSIRFPASEYPSISGLTEVKDAPKVKSKYDIIAYAGMNYVDKVINSPGNTIYMQRRENEEAATFLPYGGLQIAKSLNKLEVRIGAEFSVLGEKVNYSPYKNGTYYNSYLDWDPYSYTVTDTDSAWIFGMLFLQTSSYTVNDSIQVTKTDTLNGTHYDASILSANGTNRWYLVQFPIELSYQFIRGRLGVGISGGIAPGFVVSSEGKYLLKDESGIKELSRDSKGTFMLNIGGGVEFSYLLGERFSLLLRPTVRYFLTPIEEENGASKNYRTYGVHAGIRYSIR